MKYLKWIYGNKSKHDDFEYKIDDVTVADNFDPKADFDKQGGINFTNEENALRWISRGDTLYDVILPEDAEVINVENSKTPNGIFRSNKVILTNPRFVSDELTLDLYKKSKMPELTYYKTLSALAMKGCYLVCLEIIRDKVNKSNIDLVISEYKDFNRPGHSENMDVETWNKVLEILIEIQSDLLISICVNKEPYEKTLTNDKIINLTGQSGSGKSFYCLKYENDNNYLVIDTDCLFIEEKFIKSRGINKELGEMFRKKYIELPNLNNDFDLIYNDILDYCKKYDKTIIIDCAQFHQIKDINILKGKIIVLRTDIDTCYKRCLDRWKKANINYTEEELNRYAERKKAMYIWYKGTNEFLKNIDNK